MNSILEALICGNDYIIIIESQHLIDYLIDFVLTVLFLLKAYEVRRSKS